MAATSKIDLEKVTQAAIKSLIFDVIVKKVIERAIANAAWLALPVINPIFVFIINRVATVIYDELALVVAFEVIHIKTQAELNAYLKSIEELKKSLEAGNAEQVEQAKDSFRATFRELIRFPRELRKSPN